MIRFETREDAEAHRETRIGFPKFCPAIRAKCRKDCMSLAKGNISKNPGLGNMPNRGAEPWCLHDAYCTSPLVTGEVSS